MRLNGHEEHLRLRWLQPGVEAVSCFGSALTRTPVDVNANLALADASFEQIKTDDEMVGLQQVIHLHPQDVCAYAWPGMALQLLNRYPESKPCDRKKPDLVQLVIKSRGHKFF